MHSDIKALNILKALDHSYKLADFGLAEDLEGRISANSRGGTFHYRAPEQLYTTGRRGLVFLASDVWSLGITIFRMLTGRHPFEGESGEFSGNAVSLLASYVLQLGCATVCLCLQMMNCIHQCTLALTSPHRNWPPSAPRGFTSSENYWRWTP